MCACVGLIMHAIHYSCCCCCCCCLGCPLSLKQMPLLLSSLSLKHALPESQPLSLLREANSNAFVLQTPKADGSAANKATANNNVKGFDACAK